MCTQQKVWNVTLGNQNKGIGTHLEKGCRFLSHKGLLLQIDWCWLPIFISLATIVFEQNCDFLNRCLCLSTSSGSFPKEVHPLTYNLTKLEFWWIIRKVSEAYFYTWYIGWLGRSAESSTPNLKYLESNPKSSCPKKRLCGQKSFTLFSHEVHIKFTRILHEML